MTKRRVGAWLKPVGVCLAAVIACSLVAACAAMFVWVQWAREEAMRSQCKSNLKQLAFAVFNYADFHGSLPPTVVQTSREAWHSWRTIVVMFDLDNLSNTPYDISKSWDDPTNATVHGSRELLKCPSHCADPTSTASSTNYVAIVGPGTLWSTGESASFDVLRANPSKLLLVEIASGDIAWNEPKDVTLEGFIDQIMKSAPHRRSFNFARANFSVGEFAIPEGMRDQALRAYLTKALGEMVTID